MPLSSFVCVAAGGRDESRPYNTPKLQVSKIIPIFAVDNLLFVMPEIFRFYGFLFFSTAESTSRCMSMWRVRVAWPSSIEAEVFLFCRKSMALKQTISRK